MRTARNVALLVVATLFGVAQACIAPYFDPGETGSGVVVSTQQSVGWGGLAHVVKTWSSSVRVGTSGQVGAQWLDPGFTFRAPLIAQVGQFEGSLVSDVLCRYGWGMTAGGGALVQEIQLASLGSDCQNVLV